MHRPDRVVAMQAQHTIKCSTTHSRASVRKTGDGGIALHDYEHQHVPACLLTRSEGLTRTDSCGYIPTRVLSACGCRFPCSHLQKRGKRQADSFHRANAKTLLLRVRMILSVSTKRLRYSQQMRCLRRPRKSSFVHHLETTHVA